MHFIIKLHVDKDICGSRIPISYSYELSAWIYKIIGQGNKVYAQWLHDNGFLNKHRKFKLFVFSNLYSPNIGRDDDRLILQSQYASFQISFLPERSTEEFIKGIFSEQEFFLGDRKSKVQFRVRQVEMLPPPDFIYRMDFKTLSPIVISKKNADGRIDYVSPETESYGQFLVDNLIEKYYAFNGKEFTGDRSFSFKLLSPVQSKLICIKANTPDETKVRGFNCRFRLEADPELQRIIYEAGAGEKGSLGFGMVDLIE